MEFIKENDTLLICLNGRVDSSNAEATEAELKQLRAENPHEKLVLDAEELEYISSAGLRIILRLRKEEPTLNIINASAEVYDIFDMTGFTEMLPIAKAYRRLSVEGCQVIGGGANGKVYRFDPDTIIKVYFNPDSLPDIQRERDLARKAFVLGIPTAISYDVVKVGEGYGSVFELLNAKLLSELMMEEPDKLDYYVGIYVDLMKKLHSTEVTPGDMPDMKQVALNWVSFLKDYLPEEQYNKIYDMVSAVPQDNHMLHGDYHVKNVMMQNGEALLIDMDTLCLGNPVFEFASIYQAYLGFSELDHGTTTRFLGIPWEMAEQIWQKSLRLYFGADDEQALAAYADKARVICYVRMMRREIRRNGFEREDGRAFIAHCQKKLEELLGRVDSLIFE